MEYMSGFPSLVKGERLKIACVCFVGSNPTPDIVKTFDSEEGTAVLAQLVERQTFNLVVQGSSP